MSAATTEARIQPLLLETWLPVAAIAHMAGIPTKTALALLQRKCHEWALECRRVRIDGHNPVHMYRKRSQRRQLVMGVWMPVAEIPEEEEV